jgi:hypothetical protein
MRIYFKSHTKNPKIQKNQRMNDETNNLFVFVNDIDMIIYLMV